MHLLLSLQDTECNFHCMLHHNTVYCEVQRWTSFPLEQLTPHSSVQWFPEWWIHLLLLKGTWNCFLPSGQTTQQICKSDDLVMVHMLGTCRYWFFARSSRISAWIRLCLWWPPLEFTELCVTFLRNTTPSQFFCILPKSGQPSLMDSSALPLLCWGCPGSCPSLLLSQLSSCFLDNPRSYDTIFVFRLTI